MDRKTVITQLPRRFAAVLSVKGGLLFLLSAVFTCGKLPGGASPFGISLACAVTGKMRAAWVALGTMAGAAVSGNFTHGVAALAVLIIRLFLGMLLASGEIEKKKKDTSEKPLYRAWLILRSLPLRESIYARMMLSAAVTLINGGIELAGDSYSISLLASAAASGAVAPVLVFLYGDALEERGDDSLVSRAALCAVAVSAVLGFGNLLPFIDLSLPAAFAVTVAVTQVRGVLEGALYGVILSLVSTPAGSPVFAVAALAAAPFRSIAPAAGVASALMGAVSWSLYSMGIGAMSTVVPKLIITSALIAPFCASGIIPKGVSRAKSISVHADESMTLVVRDSEMRRRMRSLSEGLSHLSEVLYRLSDKLTAPDTEELCELCDASFEEYCSKCGMRSACFGREAKATTEMQSKMVLAMKKEGRVSAATVPRELASRCFNMGHIIDSMNAGCSRLIAEAKLYDRTAVVAADYEVTSRLLEESAQFGIDGLKCDGELTEKMCRALRGVNFRADRVAVFGGRQLRVVARGVDMRSTAAGGDDIRRVASAVCNVPMASPEFSVDGSCVTMTVTALPSLAVRCGRASIAMSALSEKERDDTDEPTRIFSRDRRGLGKTSSEDCGDVINAFLTDEGRFFMLISDGMGSGREAALTSGICAVFIEKLLRAGASMDTALKMLNSMMRVRGGECSATVDLMELDLMNGCVRFVKSGAAPSFVIRDGRLFRLQSKTVPIGIMRALDAEMIRFEAVAGDVIVMLSDGVAKSFEDCPWLYDLLSGDLVKDDDPERMARTIIKCAVENGASDDITAGVVLVEGPVSRKQH